MGVYNDITIQLKFTLLPIPKTRIGLGLFNAPQKITLI